MTVKPVRAAGRLENENRALRERILEIEAENAMLKQRVIAFESLSTKRMKEATTAEDWRLIAEHMEYNWRCCSDGFNKRCGELKDENAVLREAIKNHAEEAAKLIAAAPKPE